jgi:methionine synthase II (cobalamin-independent)
VIDGFEGLRTGLHVCRGNWSRREDVLLSGDYEPLVPAFEAMKVRQLVLEYATPRAGDIEVVGLGVVNPRTSEPESVESIVAAAERALRWFRPEQLFLNPDCGFGCFANRCVNDERTATAKLSRMAAAARVLRERHG